MYLKNYIFIISFKIARRNALIWRFSVGTNLLLLSLIIETLFLVDNEFSLETLVGYFIRYFLGFFQTDSKDHGSTVYGSVVCILYYFDPFLSGLTLSASLLRN